MPDATTPTSINFLTRGRDIFARAPDFKLIGRKEELEELSGIMMRNKQNSVLISGPGGVGVSALCMGLQASKEEPDAPFDIINKRLYWLDVNGLFSSGDSEKIKTAFEKIVRTVENAPDSVLIIENMKDFLEASARSGCSHFINAIQEGVKGRKFQTILQCRDDDLESVLKCHSDMLELYTLMDLEEPKGEELLAIVTDAVKQLEKHHNIKISPDAIQSAIELTNKYRTKDLGLSRAQPERSLTLIDRALTTYRMRAHKGPLELDALEIKLANLNMALNEGKLSPDLEGRTPEELQSIQAATRSDIEAVKTSWTSSQERIKQLYLDQREGEETIREYEDSIESAKKKEGEARLANPTEAVANFGSIAGEGGFESKEVKGLREKIKVIRKGGKLDLGQGAVQVIGLEKNKAEYDKLTASINEKLLLNRDMVVAEFSSISGIAANKLNQDERVKLLGLEKSLTNRVFGQENACERLADAVITARVSRRKREEPQAAFLFLGPSGVGKTEIAKALASYLLDDENALLRFDMSEYMEKNAAAKMIGAPPGYELAEAGGILTNAMRKNPNRIILFDEIEKAHKDVYDLMLQILSDGRLTDNLGRTVSFADSIIIMTSNVGQPHFLDTSLTRDEAKVLALKDLDGAGFRPEFLNRFNGRENIVPFDRLELDSIHKIVRREINKLDADYGEQGVHVDMPQEALLTFCEDRYDPTIGARGLPGFIKANLETKIARTILRTPDAKGTMLIGYDKDKKAFQIDPPKLILPDAPAIIAATSVPRVASNFNNS